MSVMLELLGNLMIAKHEEVVGWDFEDVMLESNRLDYNCRVAA